jgi:hypothetical protein
VEPKRRTHWRPKNKQIILSISSFHSSLCKQFFETNQLKIASRILKKTNEHAFIHVKYSNLETVTFNPEV